MGGGAPKAQENTYAKEQHQLSREIFETQKPVMNTTGMLANWMLSTGKLPSQFFPFVGKAMEGNKMNLSRAQQATQDSLGRSRMAGTPFGQRILADQRQQGEFQLGQQYGNLFFPLLSQLMAATQGNAQVAQSGMGSAASAEANRIAAQTQAQGQYKTAMMQGFMNMGTKMIPSYSFTGTV